MRILIACIVLFILVPFICIPVFMVINYFPVFLGLRVESLLLFGWLTFPLAVIFTIVAAVIFSVKLLNLWDLP
jgi:hypothetical protein